MIEGNPSFIVAEMERIDFILTNLKAYLSNTTPFNKEDKNIINQKYMSIFMTLTTLFNSYKLEELDKEADKHIDLVQEMLISKNWTLPDAFKGKTNPEINDLFLTILIKMQDNNQNPDIADYNEMTKEIKIQLNGV